MQNYNNNPKHIKFDEELNDLLTRYCSESLVRKIQSDKKEIPLIEKRMHKSSKDRDEHINVSADLVYGFHLDTIIARCEEELSPPEYYELLNEIGDICKRFGQFEKSREIYHRVILSLNGDIRYSKQKGIAFLRRSEIFIRQAEWDSALADLKIGKQHFLDARYNDGIGHVENSLGILYAEKGELKKSIHHWKNAHAIFEDENDEMTAAVLMSLGIANNIAGEWDEALSYYQRALPKFEQIGSMSRLAELHHNIGMTFLSKGNIDSAINQFDESISYSSQQFYQSVMGLSYLGKADAYARKGDYSTSMLFIQNALDIFRKLNDHLSIADTYKIKGIIHRETGNTEIAEVYLKTSIRLNELYQCALGLGESQYELGILYNQCSEKQKAVSVFQNSLQNFQRVGAYKNEQSVKESLASALE